MGAGSSSAGSGFAGADGVVAGVNVNPLTPAAMRYEGGARDWVLSDDTNYRAVHPVDQQMALGCLTRKGTLKSAPSVGNTVFDIPYLGGLDLSREINDRIRNAVPIKALLDNGDISIDRIDHEVVTGGGLKFAVYYRNLRLDPTRVISQQVAT